MSYFNQHSFTIIAIGMIVVFAFLLIRRGFRSSDFTILGALILGFIAAFLLLRTGPSTEEDPEKILSIIGTGSPVLLVFQSEY